VKEQITLQGFVSDLRNNGWHSVTDTGYEGIKKVFDKYVVAKVRGKTTFSLAFQSFMELYPKKQGKLDAWKAWNQTAEIRPDDEQLMSALNMSMQQEGWQKDGGKYIPLPATYLRQGRWMDEEVKITPVRQPFDDMEDDL